MGRPLYSTLINPAPVEPVVRVAESETPACERWSYVNADDPMFDPDSDTCFKGDVVYEAFLTPEEVAQREQERQASEAQTVPQSSERVQAATAAMPPSRLDFLQQIMRAQQLRERERVEGRDLLLQHLDLLEDDSSSSEGSASGRVSPVDAILGHASRLPARREEMLISPVDEDQDVLGAAAPPSPVIPRHSISLPPSPPYPQARLLDSLLATADLQEGLLTPARSAPIAIQQSPQNTSVVMTPPGSVTPRFLHWSSRPRAIPMSPSPTPDAPLGSIRASRMAVSFIAPSRPPIGVEL